MNLHMSLYYKYYCVQLILYYALNLRKTFDSPLSDSVCSARLNMSHVKHTWKIRVFIQPLQERLTPVVAERKNLWWIFNPSNMEKPFLHPQSTTQNSQILAAGFLAYLWKKKLWKIGGSIFPMGGESKYVLFRSSRDSMNTQYTKTWNHTGNWLSKLRMHAVDRSTTCPNYKMIQNASKPSDQYIQSAIHTGNIQKAKVDVSCVAAICWQCRSILRSCCQKLGHKSAGELHFAICLRFMLTTQSHQELKYRQWVHKKQGYSSFRI